MPAPLAAALVGAGASILQGAGNIAFQSATNRRSRKFAEEMYARQRADAIADWERQNEYNHPKAQMARLRDANLNPNLVYGSGADAQGGVVRSTDSMSWSPKAPELNLQAAGDSLYRIYDIKMKEAQIDNMIAQNSILAAQGVKEWEPLRRTKGAHEATMYESMLERQYELLERNINKTEADIGMTLKENERRELMNAQSVREAIERIASIKLGRKLTDRQIQNLNKDMELKQLDIDLRRKYNLTPGDPLIIRLIPYFLEKLGISL